MTRLARLFSVAFLLAGAAGCSGKAVELPTRPPEFSPAEYRLAPGDLLSIKFYHASDLNEDVVIRPDGMISMQLIGDVSAAGLTPTALTTRLTSAYASELT